MDPVTLLGVVASSVQIAQFIGSTIQNLHTLKGKFQDADITIRLLIGQLSTIKAAITQIHEWAQFNFDDSPKEQKFLDGLNVALDGCKAAMDALSDEVKDLIAGTGTAAGAVPATLGMRARVRAVWSEHSMKAHQDRLYGQVQALQLLLTAGQCWDAMSQARLLGLKENQRIIQKVADDTRTLRESQSSAGSQATRSARGSTIGGTTFDFDSRLGETQPYRAVATRRNTAPVPSDVHPVGRRARVTPPRNDEGYETGSPHSDARSPGISRTPSASSTQDLTQWSNGIAAQIDMMNLNVYRRSSIAATSTASEPAIHRWLSSSSSVDSSPLETKPSDFRKKKFWPSRLNRLNTFSASQLPSPAQRTKSAGPSFSSGQRRKRNQEVNITQSLDFTSADGLETPALVRVAQAGNTVEIKRLLDNGEDIEACHFPTQRTALAVAAHCGNAEVVNLFMKFKAKVGTRDHQASTPLHLASSRDHYKVLEILLHSDDIDIEAVNSSKQTALWVAADCGHLKAVEMLLKRGAKINARASNQLTPLHTAAKQGDKEMAELLLRHKAHLEARDSDSMTALHYACENGHEFVVDFLLQRGASIEGTGRWRFSPLLFAASSGHLQVVTLLSKRKASLKSADDVKANALHWSARNGHLEVVEYLLDRRMSLHSNDAYGRTPLHHAAIGSYFAVVDFLLRTDASVDCLCYESKTPLHYACESDNPDIVRLLLGAGANVEAQVPKDCQRPIHIAAANGCVGVLGVLHDWDVEIGSRGDGAGDRPLCIASRHGHVDVVEKLLDYGEPLRKSFETRPSKDSPLCIASRAGHLEVVRLLIQKGASVKERDEYGYIPLRYAAHYGHPEVLHLLLEEGAELIDDGEDSHGWGFVLMPDMIGFSEDSDISEDRRYQVRALLEEAESNIDRWNRDDAPDIGFHPRSDDRSGVRQMLGFQGNGMPRPELHGSGHRSDNQGASKSELSSVYGPYEMPSRPYFSQQQSPPSTAPPPLRSLRSPPQAHYRPRRGPSSADEDQTLPQPRSPSRSSYFYIPPVSTWSSNGPEYGTPKTPNPTPTVSPYSRIPSIPENFTLSESRTGPFEMGA